MFKALLKVLRWEIRDNWSITKALVYLWFTGGLLWGASIDQGGFLPRWVGTAGLMIALGLGGIFTFLLICTAGWMIVEFFERK